MRQSPLQLANPDGDTRQFGGVFVEFNAQHIVRAGHQIVLAVQPQVSGFEVAAQFDVFEALERQKQKIAAATGRVQHAIVF